MPVLPDKLLENLPGAVFVLDAAGGVRACNPCAWRESGRDAAGLAGTAFADLLAPSDRAAAGRMLAAALVGATVPLQANLQRGDGCTAPFLFTASSPEAGVVLLVGVPLGAVGAVDSAASLARQHLDAIVRTDDVAIVTHGTDGTITSWNAGAQRLFGHAPEEIVERPLSLLFPAARADELHDTLQRVMRGEEVRHFETERVHRDGRQIGVSATVRPIRDPQGRVVGGSVILRDISMRRRMERALRDSEQRFRSTIDSVMEGCQLLGFDWRYLYLNEAAAVQNRRPNRDLLGRTMTECWPGIEHTPVFAMLRRTMEERVPLQSEVEFVFPDGTAGFFEVRGQPVPEGLFILSIDISARRRHELELERLNRLYDALSHVNQAIVRLTGRDELFAEVCRVIVEHGGFGMAWIGWRQPDGRRVLPVASCGDANGYLQRIEVRCDDSPSGRGPTGRAVRSGEICVSNDLLGDDTTRPWRAAIEQGGYRSSAAFPIQVRGVPAGVLSVYAREKGFFQSREVALLQEAVHDVAFALEVASRDVERQRIAKQAETERHFSEAMIESLPGVAYFYDDTGRFLRWNRNFLTVTGYSAEDMAALHPRDFFLGEDRERVEQAIGGVFVTGEGSVEAGFVARDGSVTPYYFTGRRLDLDGRAYLVGVGIDISARERAEAEVRRLNSVLEQRIAERTAQLEVANRELESFSYSVSHDLRAPLRAVNGFCDILVEDFAPELPEEARRYLLRIRDAGRRMGDLIDDLLGFSRLSRQALMRAPVDMTALARRAMQDLAPQCEGRRVEFRMADLPSCEGDAALLQQVWANLLSNAVKYSRGREPALVEVGCTQSEGMRIYHVRDNGSGFDMRYAGKLFGVFQRLHRSDEFEGTGVGLAIVQRILQRHGGRIWAEAVVDQGATFHFTVDAEAAR